MATQSNILAWSISGTEEPDGVTKSWTRLRDGAHTQAKCRCLSSMCILESGVLGTCVGLSLNAGSVSRQMVFKAKR